ncbi:conserved hypothetical protein [Paecilomyces variotii No. 5]|uniref:DUF3074 domain-containing protein n=1 Tax=Byssochlamys spectabilis (strain No. 5 / NBRC 109023) TaxID=1356009 RepID=V5FVE0_BYSSN|nr:conserved hypothetical protein [Paecilomyces variotii No. 5]
MPSQLQPQRLIRLAPLPLSALPSHPALAERPRLNGESNHNNNTQNNNNNHNNNSDNGTATRPPLAAFIKQALDEAQTLLCDTIPLTFRVDKKLRSSPPSNAKVQLSSQVIPSPPSAKGDKRKIKDEEEYWVCRKSVHVDAPEEGTASWKEFENGLRFDHSQHEMEYTPSVSSVETLLEWKDVDLGQQESGGGWRGVEMHVNMITHTFHPSILISPRTFITCVISAFRSDSTRNNDLSDGASSNDGLDPEEKEFVTIQIPIEPPSNPSAEITDAAVRSKFASAPPKDTIFANYASVERVHSLPSNINILKSPRPSVDVSRSRAGSIFSPRSSLSTARPVPGAGGPPRRMSNPRSAIVEWTMATTSDAGGLIPSWVQRSWTLGGVPKAVVADVGLFLGWVAKKREAEELQELR